MGLYVEPADQSKEGKMTWLLTNMQKPLTDYEASKYQFEDKDLIPVVYVDNGPFAALAILFSRDEIRAFTDRRDHRPKFFGLFRVDDVRKVSHLPEDWYADISDRSR